MTDPQLRQEVTTAIERHLRANRPEGSSMDDVGAGLAAAIMRTAELVMKETRLRLKRRRPKGSLTAGCD